jgi:hypothetical protein
MGLAYWYVTAVALSVAGFILAWVYLFRLGPTDEYWACMDAHARVFKGTYQAEEVFPGGRRGLLAASGSDRTGRTCGVASALVNRVISS